MPVTAQRVRFFGLLGLLIVGFAPAPLLAQQFKVIDHPTHVKRIAMDLRGARPTAEDLATSPNDLGSLIDRYMATPEFGKMMMWLANDIFLTRSDVVEYFQQSYDYNERRIRHQVAKAVGEEPLRLFEFIVRNDRPLTELVTADYTVANATLAFFWNIEIPAAYGTDQWMRGRYLDGRPHAGVLSQTSFFYRYPSTLSNKHRHRANELTRILLGDDHLLRNVAVELRQTEPDQDLLDATLTNPACIACHSSLDGIVAYINGYSIGPDRHGLYARENFAHLSAHGTERAFLTVGRDPSYYGYPGENLRDLGAYIAADPRFAQTMVKHFYRFFLHRDLDYRDRDLIIRFAEYLVSTGFNSKDLIKAILLSEEYRAIGVKGGAKEKAPVLTPEEKVRIEETDPVQVWSDFQNKVAKSKSAGKDLKEWIELAEFHKTQAGYAVQTAKALGTPVTVRGVPKQIASHSPSELAQPFKMILPEQLHLLGLDLLGEDWGGNQAGQRLPDAFPTLEYAVGVKTAMGGYDGVLRRERRWTVTPTFLLVLETWAEVLAGDIYNKELRKSVPWGERHAFKLITGKEDPIEAEPTVKQQIASWWFRFYGETVDPFGPEVQELYDLLLEFCGRGAKTYSSSTNTDVRVAWRMILELMLSDPRTATY